MEKITQKKKYFVVRERAVPEVLLKVVQAKKLLDSEKVSTVQEAAEQTGISRSSFYKYKDDIFPFHEETRGKTITFIIQMDDEPGILSVVLQTMEIFLRFTRVFRSMESQLLRSVWIFCRARVTRKP